MLSSSSFPMTTSFAQASFPETGYGYVPDGGSIFFLSRLDGELGAFLALTGYKLVKSDLVHLKLANDLTITNLDLPLDKRVFNIHYNQSLNDWVEKWPETYKNHLNEKNEYNAYGTHDLLSQEDQKKIDFLKYNESYTYPWERESEGQPGYSSIFHSMVSKELAKGSKEARFNYKDYEGRTFTNTAKQFTDIVYSGLPLLPVEYFSLVHVLKDIDRLFRFDSVKEILDALKNENSVFAEWCISQIESKSALASEVAIKMLRNARTMNYYEIIKQEINVANNIVMKNPDFDLYMENKMNRSRQGSNNITIFSRSVNEITQKEVEEIFKDSKILNRINLDLKPNSLLPHNRYLNDHPDCFRLWINETPRANYHMRKHFDYEIKNYLIHKFGIDVRDTNLTIDEVRNVLGKIETNKFTSLKDISKVGSLVSNVKFLEEYFSKRQDVIEKYKYNKDYLREIMDKKLNKIFEEGVIKKSKEIYKRCEEVRDLEKKRTWVRLKRWLFMNRIMEYKNKKRIVNSKRVEALGEKKLFIPYKLDTNFRDEVNPLVKKSAFYQLSGLFNLKKLSPEYAVKFATSNKNSNIFEFLEINKDKLIEIKEKLKNDPKSFLDAWNSALDKEAEAAFNHVEDPTLVEYERVYRLRHEGHSTLDKLPFYKEFVEFKNNWMETKRKTTEFLRKLTLQIIEEVIQQEASFGKSIIKLNEDKSAQINLSEEKLEDIKELYNIIKPQDEISESDMSFFNKDSKLPIESFKFIRNNIDTVIKSDPFFEKLNFLSDKKGDIYLNFREKVMDLTQSLILNSLAGINNSNIDLNSTKKFSPDEIESNLRTFFSKENGVTSNEFLNFLYAKHGTQSIFLEVLKKSKFTAVSLIKNLIENEIFLHNNKLLTNVRPGQIEKIKNIYEKEKSLLEDVLKEYYELKLSILNMDIISQGQEKINPVSMEDYISTLKEVTFSHLILGDSKDVPKSFELLMSKIDEKNKERELVELYVNLSEVINKNSSKSTDSTVISYLSKMMKNSEWYQKVENYVKTNDLSENNLDSKIENFMKNKFNDLIYNNKLSEVDYMIDKRKLNDLFKEKLDVQYLQSLAEGFQSGKISLNEDKNDKFFSDPELLSNKLNIYKINNELHNKLNKMEQKYNLSNLKSKYIDYIFNSSHYIHKVLLNIKNTEEIYSPKNIQSTIDYGKFLFEIKSLLDQTHFDLSKNKKEYDQFVTSDHLNRLRALLFNQKAYVDDLEKLSSFLENKKKFTSLIFDQIYDDLPFTSKFEVNILTNDIQTDIEKLYGYLKNNKIDSINRQDFVIPDDKFYKLFSNINFDEFVGLEEKFSHLSDLNMRIKKIFQKKLQEVNSEINTTIMYNRNEIENLVRKLVTYEVAKGANEKLTQNQYDSLITEILEKERNFYSDLSLQGKLRQDVGSTSNFKKEEYMKELVEVAQVYTQNLSAPQGDNGSSKHGPESFNKCLNKNLADKLNIKMNSLSGKVFSTLQGLKHLQYIKSNKEKVLRDPNNLYTLQDKESHLTFDEFVKKQDNPSLKFNKVVEIIFGRKYTLQELIIDDRQKTISDYGNNNQFKEVFSKKLPVDLIKTALEVYDARIIKALKFIFASEKEKGMLSFDNLLGAYGNESGLSYKQVYLKGEEAIGFNTVKEMAEDFEEDMKNYREEIEDNQPALEDLNQANEEGQKMLEEFRNEDQTYAIIDQEGSKVMFKYKKNSIFDSLINIQKMESGKRRALGENIIQKLNSVVPQPDFSSQYTVLKYIYDYYMGTLQVSYENYSEEAENRILEVNAALRFENLEKVAKIDPYLQQYNRNELPIDSQKIYPDESLNPKYQFNPNKLSVNFDREVNEVGKDEIESAYYIPSNKEDLYRPRNNFEAKRIEHFRNLAYNMFLTKSPNNWRWAVNNGSNSDYSVLVENELIRWESIATYTQLKIEGKYDELSERTKAATMLLTEDFRAEADHVEQSNKNLRNKEFNTYDKKSIGFDHLHKNQKSEYDKVLDDMFGEYLKNKKQSLQYTKEKLQEHKEKSASFEQLTVTNPYALLNKNQQEYYEMKNVMNSKNDSRMKIDLHSFLKANAQDKEYASFFHSDLTEIIDLDNATSKAINGKFASIPKNLVDESEKDASVFHYNGKHIFNKNEEEWFEDQIEKILSKFFEKRNHLEKTLSREELYSVDQDLLKNFTHENVIDSVKKNLNKEVLEFNLLNDIIESERNGFGNDDKQKLKFKNKQFEFNKNMKDENAYFQHLAYTHRLEKEYMDKVKADLQFKKKTTRSTKVDPNISSPLEDPLGFEHLYARDLLMNQVYNDERKEGSEEFMRKYKAREFSNLGRSHFSDGHSAGEKFNHLKNITQKVESNPGKGNRTKIHL